MSAQATDSQAVLAELCVKHRVIAPLDAVDILRVARDTGNDPVRLAVQRNAALLDVVGAQVAAAFGAPPGERGLQQAEAVVAYLAAVAHTISYTDAMAAIADSRAERCDALDLLGERVAQIKILAGVAAGLGYEFVDLNAADRGYQPDQDLLQRCEAELLERFCAVPMVDTAGDVAVAVADPEDPDLVTWLNVKFPEGYKRVIASGGQIRAVLVQETAAQTFRALDDTEATTAPQGATAVVGADPVVAFIDSSLQQAVSLGASDLHFEMTYDARMWVRFRVDGELIEQRYPQQLMGREPNVIAALMTRAGADASNRLEPAGGSFMFTAQGRRVDSRVSMVPTIGGPSVVVRLLDPANLRRLPELGFGPEQTQMLLWAIRSRQGLIVVSGPTGSGKTTTLYAGLQEAQDRSKKVMSIEDPVEYRLRGVTQCQVNRRDDGRSNSFDRLLVEFLRQDPDVILIGEIRDEESAHTAVDAAVTGHLVLSTVHAQSALGVFSRMEQMGAAPYHIAEAMLLSVAQRLVKRVHSCAQMQRPTDSEIEDLHRFGVQAPELVARAAGCTECASRGFRGRVGIADMVVPNADVRRLITLGRPAEEVRQAAAQSGWIRLQRDAERLLANGVTTVSEILGVMSVDQASSHS